MNLTAAWKAFEGDLTRLEPVALPSFRQAFKNGAARVVVMREIPDDVELVRRMIPWMESCFAVHLDWGERHRDCLLAGGMGAATLLRTGVTPVALIEQIRAFPVTSHAQEN